MMAHRGARGIRPTTMSGTMPDFDADVTIIGAGIMGATLGVLLQHLQPHWSIAVLEARSGPAQESTAAWNNSGTGHSGFCELDYPAQTAGGLDVSKSLRTNEQFQITRQVWASLIRAGVLPDAARFVHPTPHMAFAWRAADAAFVCAWHARLAEEPLFAAMRFTDDRHVVADWARMLVAGRDPREAVVATREESGTEVDYGALTGFLMEGMVRAGAHVSCGCRVTGLTRVGDGWVVTHGADGASRITTSRFVFVAAGGGSLPLLQGARLPAVHGYAGFPVSGGFLWTDRPEIAAAHQVKAYGRATAGVPSLGAPHLDHRVLDGREHVLFGPFAGFSTRFLRAGSLWDLPASLHADNIAPLVAAGARNLDLVTYLVREITATRDRRLRALQTTMPSADARDWTYTVAGQRVQVIKRDASGHGILQFGTELVVDADARIAGLLGASPGASTAVPIMIDLLRRGFPDDYARWKPALRELAPSLGRSLNTTDAWAQAIRSDTADVLGLHGA